MSAFLEMTDQPDGARSTDAFVAQVMGGPEVPLASVFDRPRMRGGDRGSPEIAVAGIEIARLLCVFDAYQAALDRHAIVAVTDRAGRIVHVNDKFCAVSGYSRQDLLGQSHRIVNSGVHPAEFFVQMWRTIAAGQQWHGEICNRGKDGVIYWVDTTIVPLTSRESRIEGFISVRYDITKRKAAEAALQEEVERRRQAEALLVDIIETVPDGIAAFDGDDRLVLFNQSYLRSLSRSKHAIHGGATFQSILAHGLENGQYLLQKNTAESRDAWFRARLREHRNPGKRIVQALSDGRWIQIQERRSSMGYTVGTRTDITELKQSEAAIKFHAEHDPLTGLLNRSVLPDRLSEAVAGSLRLGQAGALLVVDLDGFKSINDTMGHAAGDLLLIAVAHRLAGALRRSDTVVRLGGDEFAIVLPHVGNRLTAERVAQKLLAAVQQPTTIHRRTLTPHLSLGIAVFPRDGSDTKALLMKADAALYQAKAEGRGTYRIFSKEMRSKLERRRRTADALAASVVCDQIDVALQPQFDLSDRRHIGFEALARWQRGGKPVSPAEFIPIAEETGLITELGWQVLRKATRAIGQLRRDGLCTGTVAVNVAAAQLKIPDFPDALNSMVTNSGLAPKDVEIELTENILLDRGGDEVARVLERIRTMGFAIALDDFGTGYASLAHLSRFPVDRLKIDRSFVREMCGNADAQTIVRATLGLAHNLGMSVVAEGIETEEQLARLHACDCDFGQGYLVSAPLEPRDLRSFLEQLVDSRSALPPVLGSAPKAVT